MIDQDFISFKFLREAEEWEKIIDLIWDDSDHGCLWNTKEIYKFRLTCLKDKYETNDFSFLIYYKDQPIGFFFFLSFKDKGIWSGNFSGIPLYWPCFLNVYAQCHDLIGHTFNFIDKICRDNEIEKINIMVNASSIDRHLYENSIKNFFFIDESYNSHITKPTEFTIQDIRPKYRQMINKHHDRFKLKIINFESINDKTINDYYELHVLDSGGKHRDYETYVAQFQIILKGGFIVCAEDGNNIPVGMLMILIGKNEAYDGSVAIHPEYSKFGVSQLLKLKAMEYLRDMGISLYELGQAWYHPTISHIPNAKNYGINFFKDGWSRGKTRKVYVSTKFFTEKALDLYLNNQKDKILSHVMNNQI